MFDQNSEYLFDRFSLAGWRIEKGVKDDLYCIHECIILALQTVKAITVAEHTASKTLEDELFNIRKLHCSWKHLEFGSNMPVQGLKAAKKISIHTGA